MRQHTCQFRFVLDRKDQRRRYEDVPFRNGHGFVRAATLILANHFEFPGALIARQPLRQLMAELADVIADEQIIQRVGPGGRVAIRRQ